MIKTAPTAVFQVNVSSKNNIAKSRGSEVVFAKCKKSALSSENTYRDFSLSSLTSTIKPDR